VSWTVLIPVKPSSQGKSRLNRTPDVARAIALDTIAAAAATGARVIVVTADATIVDEIRRLPAELVLEPAPTGIASAIARGLPGNDGNRAVLLGDLPGLDPDELAEALIAAESHPRAFVPDAEGTGTTLVTALSGVSFEHGFGPGSAARHRSAGLVELPFPSDSTLRRDVDVEQHLQQLSRLGRRTRQALGLD
jgi:2-phospho-L-lactate guanylyltransferase